MTTRPKTPYLKTMHKLFGYLCKLFNYIGTGFMAIMGFIAVVTMILYRSPNISDHLTERVVVPFLWGPYSPYAYQVLIGVGIYFAYYKKFQWKSIFMWMFAWAANDIMFNALYDTYHIEGLIYDPANWHLSQLYPFIIILESLIGIIGYIVLRPKFSLKYSFWKYLGVVLNVGGYVYLWPRGWPISSMPQYANDPIIHILSFVGFLGWLLFIYEATTPGGIENNGKSKDISHPNG